MFLSGSAEVEAAVETHVAICPTCRGGLDDRRITTISSSGCLEPWRSKRGQPDTALLDVMIELKSGNARVEKGGTGNENVWQPGTVRDQYRIEGRSAGAAWAWCSAPSTKRWAGPWPSRCCARKPPTPRPRPVQFREARLVAKLRHDNVVAVYAVVNPGSPRLPGHGAC